jgi:hypothetical protein
MPSRPETKSSYEKERRKAKLDAGICCRCEKRPRAISRKGKTKGKLSIQCAECNERKSKAFCAKKKARAYVPPPPPLTKLQEAVLRLPELEQKLHAAIVADKVSRMRELNIAPNIETLEKEALEAIKLAGGADKWVAERREEEARRQSREFKRHYDQYFSTEAF